MKWGQITEYNFYQTLSIFIQECESEWSHNKKLISLRDKPLRRSVPKGLPYFHVDFGTENGFAHVIEDEQEFPKNFAQGKDQCFPTFC